MKQLSMYMNGQYIDFLCMHDKLVVTFFYKVIESQWPITDYTMAKIAD